jgi:hypothetical protein
LAGSGGGAEGIGGLPVPGRQFGDAFSGVVGDPREDVGEIGLRVDPLSFAVSIKEYIAAARRPPASDPAKR